MVLPKCYGPSGRGYSADQPAGLGAREGENGLALGILGERSRRGQVDRAPGPVKLEATLVPLRDLLHDAAGVTNLTRETTVDGIEATFAVNHLAYFLLTNLLLDRILESSGARIVSVASDAHRFGGALDFDDLGLEHGFGWMKAYGRSKGANILFTQELARRIEGSGVTANCLHPGFVRSSLGGQNGVIGKIAV